MPSRIIAISDIHGCADALRAILVACQPQVDDLFVFLGDYIDRGDNVPDAMDQILALSQQASVIPLLGNHDEVLLQILDGQLWRVASWLSFGGDATLRGYGIQSPGQMPRSHVDFLRACLPYAETARHLFAHANYMERKPLARLASNVLYWESLRDRTPGPHRSGKTAILGHTSQKEGEILDLGHLICIDTYCYGGGWLTALEVQTGQMWQADLRGRLRDPADIVVRPRFAGDAS